MNKNKWNLREWLGFCKHYWVEEGNKDIVRYVDNKIIGSTIKTKCKKCGKIKLKNYFVMD